MLFISGHFVQPVRYVAHIAAFCHACECLEGVFLDVAQHRSQSGFHEEKGDGHGARDAVDFFGRAESSLIPGDKVPAFLGIGLGDHAFIICRGRLRVSRRRRREEGLFIEGLHLAPHGRLRERAKRGEKGIDTFP